MAGNYCEQFVELLDQIPGELDKAKERCVEAVAFGLAGRPEPGGKSGSAEDIQRSYDMVAGWFDTVAENITKVKNYIRDNVLPWAMAPVALEDASTRYLDLAGTLADVEGEASAASPGWGHNLEWIGDGADTYVNNSGSVVETQRRAIEVSSAIATELSDALGKASQQRFTFLISTIEKLGKLVAKVISKFANANTFMAAFRLVFSFNGVVQDILTTLVEVVGEYAKLCAESLAAAKDITKAILEGRRLPGSGWPPAAAFQDGRPGQPAWDDA